MGGTELDFVHEAFDTNWIAPLGANVNGFEQDLQDYTGRKHAAVVTSGTAALHLALILSGVKPGDEVICQSFTFAASANPIRYQGATPVFIDSEPDTWNMDPDLLEKALKERASTSSDEFPSSDESGDSASPSGEGARGRGREESTFQSPPGPERVDVDKGHKSPTDDFPSSVESKGQQPAANPETDPEAIRQMTGSRQSKLPNTPAIHPIKGIDRMKPGLPKAIIVVHLYGMPAKMDRILEIGNKYGIPVIEDAAEALGSSYHDRRCGIFGRFSVLSFNGNKIITTSGGGALLGDDESKIQKARFLATQARDEAPHYQHSELGYNYRMSNIVAGIGRGQMKVLDERVAARRRNHEFYFRELGGAWFEVEAKFEGEGVRGRAGEESTFQSPPGPERVDDDNSATKRSTFNFQLSTKNSPTGIYFLKEPEGYFSNRWLTTILVNPEETGGVTREDIRLALEEENIESRPLWKPMHLQPLYEDAPCYKNGVSDFLFEYGLCLPSGSNLTEEDRERVVEVVKKVLKG